MRPRNLLSFLALCAMFGLLAACGDDNNTQAGTGDTFDADAYAGSWTGTWRNLTFGSTGAAAMTIAADESNGTGTVVLDLDGNVLGGADPGPITIPVTFTTTQGTVDTSVATLGDLAFTIGANGQITGSATSVPAAGISRVDLNGTAGPDQVNLNYTVRFDNGTTANGVLTLTKQGAV